MIERSSIDIGVTLRRLTTSSYPECTRQRLAKSLATDPIKVWRYVRRTYDLAHSNPVLFIISHANALNSIKDIYNIPGVTANDKAMFKKYQAELTVLPPGRMFKERINQRQSTWKEDSKHNQHQYVALATTVSDWWSRWSWLLGWFCLQYLRYMFTSPKYCHRRRWEVDSGDDTRIWKADLSVVVNH